MKTNCPVCSKEPAILDPSLGILPGKKCTAKRRQNTLPRQFEVINEQLRQDRKEHAKSIIQPRREGRLSREYVEAYGTKGIEATKEEVKNAKYEWRDIASEHFDYSKAK